MNQDQIQERLFADPLGLRLRHAREQKGLDIEAAGKQTRLPVAIIEAIEREDWARLGAPIYQRSYLSSYVRFLELPLVLVDQAAPPPIPPPLVVMESRSSVQRNFERTVRSAGYLMMTGAIIVPLVLFGYWYQGQSHKAISLSLDPPTQTTRDIALSSPIVDTRSVAATMANAAQPSAPPRPAPAATQPEQTPLVASLTPALPSAATADGSVILRFHADSWIEVVDAQGKRLERGLLPIGSERHYAPGEIARITLGNANGVQVSQAGHLIDLAPYRTDNVARFTVSSDGRLARTGD